MNRISDEQFNPPADEAARGPATFRRASWLARTIGWLLLAFVLPCPALPCLAADTSLSPAIASATLGFGGQYKLGCWTPLNVTVHGGSQDADGRVVATLPDADGVPVHFHSGSLHIRAGETTRLSLCVKVGQTVDQISLGFQAEGAAAATNADMALPVRGPLPVECRLFVQIGAPIADAQSLVRYGRTELAAIEDENVLPERWVGYEGVDGLTLSIEKSEVLTRLMDDPVRWLALDTWLRAGGNVVLCASPDAETLLGHESPLGRWLPGTLAEMTLLTRADALETYSGSTQRVPAVGPGDALRLLVPRLENVTGSIDAADGRLPLVVRQPRGLGQLTFVAVPLGVAPFSTWPGRGAFAARLWSLAAHRDNTDAGETIRSQQAERHGVSDLSGQLYRALDQFEGVAIVPFWAVACLAILYLVVIGPLDYWLVKKVLGRMEWTWITLPLLSIAVCAGLVLTIFETKGLARGANQVDLIDVDLEQATLRGTSWLALYAPQAAEHELGMRNRSQPKSDDAERRDGAVAWFAPPGSGWGGMHATAHGSQVFLEPYAVRPSLTRLVDVPIESWSTKAFCARWTVAAPIWLDAELKAGIDGSVRGQLRHRLPAPLVDCVLLYGRHGYALGDWAPYMATEITADAERDVETVLKQLQVVKNAKNNSYLHAPLPYDPAGLGIDTIVRTMMFYEVLGGRQYTGLANSQQAFTDLSPLLALGRAVLVGRLADSDGGLVWYDDQQPLSGAERRAWTYVRFVIPVH